jgi:hypothetical protein
MFFSLNDISGGKTAKGGDERGGELVHLREGYLVVTQVGVQKTQELATGGEVNDLVNSEERERIFQTCLVQTCVVHTHLPFSILLWHKNWIGCLVWVLNLLFEAGG